MLAAFSTLSSPHLLAFSAAIKVPGWALEQLASSRSLIGPI